MKNSAGKIFTFLLLSMTIACSSDRSALETAAGPGGVALGMTRQEVIQAMLDDVQLLQMSGRVTNPYATRFINNINGESLEVMYYYTGMKEGDDLVSDEELVPVILKDNSVVGWGWETLEAMTTGTRLSP
jgi:hypothetical protein